MLSGIALGSLSIVLPRTAFLFRCQYLDCRSQLELEAAAQVEGLASWHAWLSCVLLRLYLLGFFAGFIWCVVALFKLVQWGERSMRSLRGSGCQGRMVDMWIIEDGGVGTPPEIFA